jgi:hypothetical protein
MTMMKCRLHAGDRFTVNARELIEQLIAVTEVDAGSFFRGNGVRSEVLARSVPATAAAAVGALSRKGIFGRVQTASDAQRTAASSSVTDVSALRSGGCSMDCFRPIPLKNAAPFSLEPALVIAFLVSIRSASRRHSAPSGFMWPRSARSSSSATISSPSVASSARWRPAGTRRVRRAVRVVAVGPTLECA